MAEEKKLALLIDSDNVSAKYAQFILQEATKHGELIYKRIYGDWERNNTGWRIPAMNNSIMPVQQNSYIAGKNATDFSMIIDAMDILYTGNVDGFVLVTSDSDFTRLAIRLRESGMLVVGIGEVKTPLAFTSSCHSFSYLNQVCDNVGEFDENVLRKAVLDYVKENDDGKLDLTKINAFLTSSYGNIDFNAIGFNRLSSFIDSFSELSRNSNFVTLKKKQSNARPQKSAANLPSEKEITNIIIEYLKRQSGGKDDISKINAYVTKVLGKIDFSRFGSKRFAKFVDNQEQLVRIGNAVSLAAQNEKPAAKSEEKAENAQSEPKSKSLIRITNQLFGMEVKKYAEENGEKGGNLGQLNNMLLEKYGKNYVADLGFADFASAVGSVLGVKVEKNFVSLAKTQSKPQAAKKKKSAASSKTSAAPVIKEPAENTQKKRPGRPKKDAVPKTDINLVKREVFDFVVTNDYSASLAALGNALAKKFGRDYLKELEFSTIKKLLASISGVTVKGDVVSLGKSFLKRTKDIEKFIYDFARNDDKKSIKSLTTQLKKKFADFDFTSYGYSKFSDFINAIDGVRANGYYVEAED